MRESDKLYKRDLHESVLYHCKRTYNIHIFVDMKCSVWCLEIKQGNQTPAQEGWITLQCLQGEESCALWRGRLPAVQRSPPVPGGLGSPSCGKFQPRKCGVGDRGVPAVRHIPDWIPGKKQSHQASLEMPKSLEGVSEGKGGLGEAC